MKTEKIIADLRTISKAVNDLADCLTEEKPEKESTEKPESVPTTENETEPEPEQTYTLDDAKKALKKVADKPDAGTQAAKELVLKHGGRRISDYKDQPEVLKALIQEAEEIINA